MKEERKLEIGHYIFLIFSGSWITTSMFAFFVFLVSEKNVMSFVFITGAFAIIYFLIFCVVWFCIIVVVETYGHYFTKIQNWLNEIKEYNKNIREQKRKNQELFEPEQSTNIYREILDEDLEDDLNRSWEHYESKRK